MSKTNSVGKAIHEMHENLAHLTEQHNENSWMQNGKERLNDILRGEKNIDVIGNEILSFFSDFLGSQLGTFYISKSETTLSLVHSSGTTGQVPTLIEKDNSFIGQALTQKKVVVLNDVDKDYFKVSTSLGSAKAASLVIIPLFVSNKMVGLAEIGKLNSFTPVELRFIDDVTESIAIYINTILAKSELEKLVVELDKKEQELQNQITAINKAALVIEFDTKGIVLKANDLFLNIMGFNSEELIGKHHKLLVPKNIDYDVEYKSFWESLNKGNNESGEFCRTSKYNKVVWLQASYNPVYDENGKVYKVIKIGYDITELKQQRIDLGKLTLNLNQQVEVLNKTAIVSEADADGNIVFVNDFFCEISEYSREELIGQNHRILKSGKQPNGIFVGMWKAISSGLMWQGEILNISKTGRYYWVETTIMPFKNKDGKIEKYVALRFDITKQKESEALKKQLESTTLILNKKEQELQNQITAINKATLVIEFDTKGIVQKANDLFLKIMGFESHELVGNHHKLLVPKNIDYDAEYKSFWESLNKGNNESGEFCRTSKDNKVVWLQASYNPVFDENGKVYKIIKIGYDITELKQQRIDLGKLTLNLNQQVGALNKAAIVSEADADGNITFVNDFFCTISEYSREELIGQNHRIVKSGKQPDGLFKGMWKAISTGLMWQGEILNISKTGKYYWVETTIMPFKNKDGKIEKYVAIRFDITKQKESEALKKQTELLLASQRELEESNTELEAQTQKLQASDEELRVQQEELLQSNKELEEKTKLVEEKNHAFNEKNNLLVAATTDLKRKADQLSLSSKYKSEFLANMSHELRTPLNSILLLSKLLKDNLEDNLSEDQIEYSAVINKAGNSLLELINDILDLSKIESGKMDVNSETMDVNKFAGDIQSLFNPFAKDKQIEFKVLVNSDCPESMYTDKMRLDQVVKNLLSNAFKFSAKGKVDLTISYNLKQDMISFSVVDTGIGIPKDKQALVFEAFQQADGSTKRKYGGTGLGLSISKEIAHLLGGEITLESEVGVGSNFTIIIPANYSIEHLKKQTKKNSSTLNNAIAPDLSAENQAENAILVEDDRHDIKNGDKTILIVEDDILFVKIIQNSAKSRGYKVLIAVNGNEAVELAKKHIPLGIILDLHLPKKSGWEVLKELKDFAETKHIPVHITSSNDLDIKTIRESGAIDFTSKPFSEDNIQNVFRSLEEIASKKTGKIALFSDKKEHALAMTAFLKERQIEIISFTPDHEIDPSIWDNGFDSIIIDIDSRKSKIPNLLEKLTKVVPTTLMPVIVLSNTYLSTLDVKKINQFSDFFILKIVKTYSSIIEEMSLFLHYITKKDQTIKMRPAIISAKTLENKKILLVDNDAENRFSISKILEAQKAEVIHATNGKEAIDVWTKNHDIALILMDVMMPEMDGYEAIKKIRKLDNGKNIPIVSLTAKTQADEREKCINSGASDYASKPIDADLLISLIKIWILNSEKNK